MASYFINTSSLVHSVGNLEATRYRWGTKSGGSSFVADSNASDWSQLMYLLDKTLQTGHHSGLMLLFVK